MFDTHTTSSISLYIHSTLCHFKRNIGWVKQTRYAGGNYEKTQSVSVLKALQHSFGADHEATFAECEILVWCISSVASSVLSVKGKKRRWRLSREIKNEISVSSRGHHHIRNTFTQKYKKNNCHCRRQYCLFLPALWQLIFRHSAKIFWCLSINKSDPQDLRFILDQGIDSYINNTYAPSLPPP